MGAHHYDIAQWALDMDGSGPVEINPPSDPNAQEGVKYIYANGVEMTHGGRSGCTFTGTRGTLYIDRGVLKGNREEIVSEKLSDKEVHLYQSPGHHREWINCIRSRQKPNADVEIGARTAAIIQLGNLAYWNQKKLKWDPKKWQFVGDKEAEEWMDRERRKAWPLRKA